MNARRPQPAKRPRDTYRFTVAIRDQEQRRLLQPTIAARRDATSSVADELNAFWEVWRDARRTNTSLPVPSAECLGEPL